MPTVSVIIPTYNRAAYLLEAIESVRAQTFLDYEILVVDDGSIDDTHQRLQLYIDQNLVQYTYQENQGPSVARNRGIQLAAGKYIAFLDSDDLFLPTKLEKQVPILEQSPEIVMVHSGYTRVDEQMQVLGYRCPDRLSGWVYPNILLDWSVMIATPTVLVRTAVLRDLGGFDESMWRSQDLDLWRRIARFHPIAVLPEPTCKVRHHAGSQSSQRAGLHAVEAYSHYLLNAFADDSDLGFIFKRKVWAKMYANIGHNLLSAGGKAEMKLVRKYSLMALHHWPFQWSAYFGFLGSFLGEGLRVRMLKVWRALRYSDKQVPNE